MNFDDILTKIGCFGRYQLMIFIPTALVSNFGTFFLIGTNFLEYTPAYRCRIPNYMHYPNDTYAIQDKRHEIVVNDSIPYAWIGGKKKWSQDFVYANHSTCTTTNITTIKCDSWVYSNKYFESTVITDFELFNEKNFQAAMPLMYNTGFTICSFPFGFLSDRFGRKPTLLVCFLLTALSGICVAISPNEIWYMIFRFFNGFCASGPPLIMFVYVMEIIGPTKRIFAAICTHYVYSFCYLLLVLFAYLIHKWRDLQMVLSVMSIPFILLGLYIPESPRWLLSQSRYDKAEAVLRKAANWNGKTLPETLFHERTLQPRKTESFKKIFKSRTLTLRILNLAFNWFVCWMVYYGVSLDTGNLGENIFIVNLIFGVVEFPAYFLCQILLDRIGRKKLHCGSFFLAAIFLTLVVGFEVGKRADVNKWLVITLAGLGKFCTSILFLTNYIIASEILPTVYRNTGIGISSAASGIGLILGPELNKISIPYKYIPFATFAILTLIGGITSTTFPETMGEPLPQTIEDAENLGRKDERELLRHSLSDFAIIEINDTNTLSI